MTDHPLLLSPSTPRGAGLHVFALHSAASLGAQVASSLGHPLSPHEERTFDGGEHKSRPRTSVRGGDVYVLADLHGHDGDSANDRLLRLLFFIGALRDAGARRVTAVVPYLCYSRKDRKTKSRDPVTTRYVARLFEAVRTDRVVTMDVHNVAAFQNAFSIPTEHLEAAGLFLRYLQRYVTDLPDAAPVVVSPDSGGAKRADAFRDRWADLLDAPVPLAFVEKERSEGVVTGHTVVGPVSGRVAIIYDDMICSGITTARAATACREKGAVAVWALATHGLFTRAAADALSSVHLDRVVVTNSIAPVPSISPPEVSRVHVAPLLAEAIRRLHDDASLVALREGDDLHLDEPGRVVGVVY